MAPGSILTTRTRERLAPASALLPALALIGVLFGSSVVYGVAQSFGYLPIIGERHLSFDAYRHLLAATGPVGSEFWGSLAFSLWVSIAATVLASGGALLIVAVLPRGRAGRHSIRVLNLNLAFPHVVWAIGILLLLSQSGLMARMATGVGLIQDPSQFPVLVQDRYGLGIIIHYVTKEIPFLALMILAILRSQPEEYEWVAANLGANAWQRLRRVILPLVMPGLAAGALLVFAFDFGAYEAPALLGAQSPRMLSVLALQAFSDADLRSRPEAMALGVLMALVVVAVASLIWYLGTPRSRK